MAAYPAPPSTPTARRKSRRIASCRPCMRPPKPEHDPQPGRDRRTTGAARAKVKRACALPPGACARSTRMSIAYRPPFDEDDELDLRAVYRKPRTGGSPELDAAVRRTWHPGHSWHPGWAAAACAALVAGLFAWTDMRENAEMIDMTPQLAVSQEAEASPERAPAPRLVGTDAPAPQQTAAPEIQRAAQPPAESQANV
ncbi:hypothetical protein HMPREF0005_03643, partial [Achromobacter xylosoxidans C54]